MSITIPSVPETVSKRDGRQVPFDPTKIEGAILKCLRSLPAPVDLPQHLGVLPENAARLLAGRVVNTLRGRQAPQVEAVQDLVEDTLMGEGLFDAARHYIRYRAEHEQQRAAGREVDAEARAAFDESAAFFEGDPLRLFMFYDKYARFDWGRGRRETWIETVDRSIGYLAELAAGRGFPGEEFERLRRIILTQQAMPSMRLLATAGPAARRQNVSIYNCSYLPIADLRAFEEILLISMAGCGVGYSVEGQYVYRLPFVRRQTGRIATHVVEDSTEGWGAALLYCITAWFEGDDVELDTSRVRPAGAVLRTKGGRASGPGPLRAMLDTIRGIILRRQGAMLRPLDAHDIACAIGGGAVSGGHRRTAMISLFDFDDDDMRRCKDGDSFPSIRWNANNSAVWPEGITQAQVMRQMLDMAEARRGEPGIFNRDSATRLRPAWRKALDLGAPPVYGTNPCGEIVLRPFEFCNLSIAVARAGDGFAELADKVVAATVLGTLQSLAVHFPGLREDWARNCSEERLLGVDVTGQADCPAARDPEVMRRLRGVVEETNLRVAALLGIPRSAALTCNKPSGNSSQFLGCASGIHARYAPHYLRRCRVSAHSPVYKVLRDAAVPMTPENGQSTDTADTWVVAFPVAAPEAALLRRDVGAIEQCRHWLRNKTEWTHHNPSCTVYYRPDELLPLTAWIWEHREAIGGLSFFPVDDARYEQPPYEEIDAATFERLRAAFPVIDWSKLVRYEDSDATTAAQELACAAGACEIDLAGRVRSIAAE